MTYRPKRAPRYRLYHRTWRTGWIQNSERGDKEAKWENKPWIDNDFHLSLDLALVNAHGAPEKVWGPHRFEAMPWTFWSKQTYHGVKLRDARTAFADAKRHGRKVEAEVKDWRPLVTDETLRAVFERMARHAEAVFGPDWREHVTVKVVSTIGGGFDAYGSRVLEAADATGFKTMVTCRGRDRFRTFAGCTYITYVRASLAIR